MATDIDLFVDADVPLQTVAKDINSVLSVKSELIEDREGNFYRFRNRRVYMQLQDNHGFENDRDLNFEDYHFWLTISVRDAAVSELRLTTVEELEDWHEKFAYSVFEKLKNTGRYRLMLVRNAGTKLAEFAPY